MHENICFLVTADEVFDTLVRIEGKWEQGERKKDFFRSHQTLPIENWKCFK
jgi:hypothetical protein